MKGYKSKIQDAEETPFDDTVAGLDAEEVQTAIENLAGGAGTGASPGFPFGRSGNVSSGAYLQNESVPSNITGRPVDLTDGRITQVSVSNENSNTFEIAVEEHDGTTFTELAVVSLTAQRSKKQTFNVSITAGKELAVKVKSGSAKNPVVTVYVKGDAA